MERARPFFEARNAAQRSTRYLCFSHVQRQPRSCDLEKKRPAAELALQLRLLSVQGAVVGATAARAGARTRTSATDGDDVNGGDSAVDIISSNSSLVKARLSKPVGLVLAEKEMGKPGLVVDDMVEEGSAEVCMARPG